MIDQLNKAILHRNNVRRELDAIEAEVTALGDLVKALDVVRAAGYRVSHSRTADAVAAPTSVGVHSGQAKPSPAAIPRADYVPGIGQHAANCRTWEDLPRGTLYEWRPVDGSSTVMGAGNKAGPDWVVRSLSCSAFPATLIHIPSGHETTGFPDYASLGRYIRGRERVARDHGTQAWVGKYHPDTYLSE